MHKKQPDCDLVHRAPFRTRPPQHQTFFNVTALPNFRAICYLQEFQPAGCVTDDAALHRGFRPPLWIRSLTPDDYTMLSDSLEANRSALLGAHVYLYC